jgi:hypothetical protein
VRQSEKWRCPVPGGPVYEEQPDFSHRGTVGKAKVAGDSCQVRGATSPRIASIASPY